MTSVPDTVEVAELTSDLESVEAELNYVLDDGHASH